jgi:membrane protein implicated in regulation of membrane protease activity
MHDGSASPLLHVGVLVVLILVVAAALFVKRSRRRRAERRQGSQLREHEERTDARPPTER